jgi:DNA-binding NtrC family response regulator/pSer/pThr/pTyr-binding forkhead associated (FHA) protein
MNGTSVRLELVVECQGQRVGATAFDSDQLSIGRDGANDVVLSDSYVSGRHARVIRQGVAITLEDMQSTGGTFINGKKIKAAVLSPGDSFKVGPYTLTLTVADQTRAGAGDFQGFIRSLLDLTGEGTVADLQAMLTGLLDRTRAFVDAESGFLVLNQGGRLSTVLVNHGSTPTGEETFSQTVCQRAMELKKPLVMGRSEAATLLGPAPSLMGRSDDRILAVPFLDEERVFGVLYLEGNHFNPEVLRPDCSLLLEIAHLGGKVLGSALSRSQIVEERNRWRWLASSLEQPDMARTARNPRMVNALETLRKIAKEDVTALILGESGTGKEIAARTIHQYSARKDGPFIAINCGAIPHELVESELFGHERGAFTGAHQRSLGKLELAQGGTLLLDEIGDLPRDIQVKLLRVLETRTFERLGSREPLAWTARLLAATHVDLEAAVARGDFRQDLFYRINVVSVRLPPLRERREDIEPLTHDLLMNCNRRFQRKLYGVMPDAMAALEAYSWPGNVRELRNIIERAFVLENSDRLALSSLSVGIPAAPQLVDFVPKATDTVSPIPRFDDFMAAQEKQFLMLVLDRMGGNVTRAAEAIGMTRQTLHRRLRALGLRGEQEG